MLLAVWVSLSLKYFKKNPKVLFDINTDNFPD